jgi:transcriptional regulator with XRE-family HTH domain
MSRSVEARRKRKGETMTTLNERLGEVLKGKRQRDRLTQADVGARIGTSGSYISAIESASTSVRISELEALAAVFKTTAFELVTQAAGPDPRTFSSANRERNAFVEIYDGLGPEQQKMARTFLLFLREQQAQPTRDD